MFYGWISFLFTFSFVTEEKYQLQSNKSSSFVCKVNVKRPFPVVCIWTHSIFLAKTIIFFFATRVYHTNFMFWFFTEDKMTVSLFRSSGLFSLFSCLDLESLDSSSEVEPVSWCCRIQRLHLCRRTRLLATNVLDMTLNNLRVRFSNAGVLVNA